MEENKPVYKGFPLSFIGLVERVSFLFLLVLFIELEALNVTNKKILTVSNI